MLPPEHLDGDWLVARCEEVVRRRRWELEPLARHRFQEILDAQPGQAGELGRRAVPSPPGHIAP